MKKIIALASVFCLAVICLTACGSNKCRYCDQKVYKDGLCKDHYYVEHPDEAISEAFKGLTDTFGSLSDGLGSLSDELEDSLSVPKDFASDELGELNDALDSLKDTVGNGLKGLF